MTQAETMREARSTSFNLRQAVWIAVIAVSLFLVINVVNNQNHAGSDGSATAVLLRWMPYILEGFGLNLVMSCLAMVLATLFGVPLGIAQQSQSAFVRLPAQAVTHLFRNAPWLVVLFSVMYLIPANGNFLGQHVEIPDWIKATFAFSLPVMGNISEIVRGAIRSIPTGQWESASGLALSRRQTMIHIILPQCVKRSIPSWMNWYALLTLSTPMAAILGVREAVGSAQAAMEAGGGRPDFLIPFYLFLLCLFFLYIYPIARLTKKLERKYAVV
ncbi:amino acid ABC transporter permease [Neorhizobium alkalisoli]|uniref:amino acid ABC transporter permease n=1 Tax=Neorhizobium alkalisoli TaxID=528178 RepID=UPI001FDEA99A|nr:ABC transporter permease subunit [Neorhizobium alkalisoli]